MTRAQFRYGVLFAIAVAITVFALVARDTRTGRTIDLLAAGAALVVAIETSGLRPRRVVGATVAVAVGGVALASVLGRPSPVLPYATTALLLVVTIGVISRGLIRLILQRGVDLTAVFGALTVYLLAGLSFAFLYGAVAMGSSTDFFAQGTDGTQSDRVYFSFTALTTTGFGDLTAATRAGHALTVLEMLMGQLYLVTVLALLIGNLRQRRPSPGA
jgi:hypothetical protein